ncbi:MAG: flagellar hook-associated protein FlgK [Sulfurimonas sp.]|jgi:flagellar hook-associated protein 1 FlgK|nr:flagellar hook-associated protein FlgK [Sulfurimonas sp.]
MASIFNALHIGYSGLNASQVGINTTSHNITNAESEGYTRQRVVTAAATPTTMAPGNVGNGTEVTTVKRIFDNFVFDRYSATASSKEFSDFEKKTLEELSTYFPEIDEVGIKADLKEYYNLWQTFSDNPDNDSIKLALVKQTETLANHISQTQDQVLRLQSQINDQLKVNIDEVNSIAKELAELNKAIDIAEAGEGYDANDLRDKRNVLELSLSRLVGANTSYGQLESNIQIDSSSNTKTGSYTVSINGFNIVDGATYHPIHITKEGNPNGFYEMSYERQDGTLIPMEEVIRGGKVGAILELRGKTLAADSAEPSDGVLQDTISQLNAFAKGLIESTNNLYAQGPKTYMESNPINVNPTSSLFNSELNLKEGSFEVVVYDIDGNEVGAREIKINIATTMTGAVGSNSIEGQLGAQIDDNNDGNANNDVDDFFVNGFGYTPNETGGYTLSLNMDPASQSKGYTFSIRDVLKNDSFDSGTNFAGALGLSRFFDGNNASSMRVNADIQADPDSLRAGVSNLSGDNTVALDMVQSQYEKYSFKVGRDTFNTTSYGMFDVISTGVGTVTNAAIFKNNTVTAQFNATEFEYASISKVSIDEEMTNLIKYQTSYGAAAKIITTIDQMMQTLLGLKT